MKHSKLFPFFFAGFFFLIITVLTGCTNPEEIENTKKSNPAEKPIQGGIYRIPLPNNPITLDPAYVQDIYGIAVVHQIFDSLVRFDSYLNILPGLAETWQVKDDGKTYQFTLRKNAKFHNLDPVTSEDVVFSITRLLRTDPAPAVLPHLLKIVGANEYRAHTRETVSGLDIKTDTVFMVHLEQSHVPFLTALGMYQASIVPKKEVLRLKENFGKQPLGTGPFRFVSWDEKKSIHLERFTPYFAGPAYLDEIHYRIYLKGQGLEELKDFQQGNIDEMAVYGDRREKLSNINGLQWFHRPSLSLFFYGMNIKHPALADPDFRKTLSLAIDRTAFVNTVYNGQFEIARTILPPGMPGYTPMNKTADTALEPERQRKAQFPGKDSEKKPELEIVSAFKTSRVEQEMEMIRNFWAGIGITLKVKYIPDWKQFETYLKSDAVQVYRYSWFADMPDPDSFLYSLFASESPTNFMNFNDDTVDRLLLTARGIVDSVERTKMYRKIEAAIMASTPLIPLFYMNVDRVYQPYVKAVKVSALGSHTLTLNKIWIDKNPYRTTE